MVRGSLKENLGLGGDSFAKNLKQYCLLLTLAMLVCLTWDSAFAGTPPRDKTPAPGAGGCAQKVWSDATD